MRYVDHSTLNNRERYAFLAGLGTLPGGIGGGSLAGSSLGNPSGLGATAPWPVCSEAIWSHFGYECQNWNKYTPEQQEGILASAKTAQAQYDSQVAAVRAGATQHAEDASHAADGAVNEAQASVDAAEAALKAACDPPVRDELIAQSDNHHALAADYAQEAGEQASAVYAIAGKGFQGDKVVMQAVEMASGAAAASSDAVKQSEDVRQQVIAAARAKQCGPGPVIDEEEEIPKKKGAQHAGMLWVGLLLLGTVGAYALMKKKKGR